MSRPDLTAFVVAIEDRPIGMAIPQHGGFRFVAVHADYHILDGSRFRRLEQLESAACSLARVVSGRTGLRTGLRPALADDAATAA